MSIIKKNFLFFVVLLTVIFGGCTSSKNYYLEPDFKENKVNSSVSVLPVLRSWFTNFPNHTFGSLDGTGKNVFNGSLQPIFAEYTSSMVQKVSSVTEIDTTNFQITELGNAKKPFNIIAPKANLSTSPAKFIILLDQFYFREKQTSASTSSYTGGGIVAKKYLYFETKYAYWDTEKKKIVGWGTSDANKAIADKPKYSDYSDVLSGAVKKILLQGPLKATL